LQNKNAAAGGLKELELNGRLVFCWTTTARDRTRPPLTRSPILTFTTSHTRAVYYLWRGRTLRGRAAGLRGRARTGSPKPVAASAPAWHQPYDPRSTDADCPESYSECPIAFSSSGHHRPGGEQGASRSTLGSRFGPEAACLLSGTQNGKADADVGECFDRKRPVPVIRSREPNDPPRLQGF
jgi:hypothetical protein